MSIPTASDLGSLDFVYLGQPVVVIESGPGQNTNSLDFVYLGLPFVGAKQGGGPPPVVYNTTQFFMVF